MPHLDLCTTSVCYSPKFCVLFTVYHCCSPKSLSLHKITSTPSWSLCFPMRKESTQSTEWKCKTLPREREDGWQAAWYSFGVSSGLWHVREHGLSAPLNLPGETRLFTRAFFLHSSDWSGYSVLQKLCHFSLYPSSCIYFLLVANLGHCEGQVSRPAPTHLLENRCIWVVRLNGVQELAPPGSR